ncbi:hypothetical protein [Streptomyces phaeochromogenes]|uniref:hypothetical protein n=1 Tax=Streptomyces phaeochromogenes TaxID=1923 RepID=UPI00371690F3
MTERPLKQGEVVRVEFDRASAPLGIELAQPGALDGQLGQIATVLPAQRDIKDDFSLGAFLVEFAIASASGVSSSVLVEMVRASVTKRAARRNASVEVERLHRPPGDESIHLVVRIERRPPPDTTSAPGMDEGN